MTDVLLEPEEGIAIADGRLIVVSLPAWLRIIPLEALSGRRWVRIRYSSGIFNPLTRPILRIQTKDGRIHYNLMNGAILGSAEWIGRIPKNTVAASISPTGHKGPFSFRIDRVEAVTRIELLARGMLTNPRRTYISVTKRLTNARQASWDLLKSLNAATPFSHYRQWHHRFDRSPDLYDFDRPTHDWAKTPEFNLFARLPSNIETLDVRLTLDSLQTQLYQRWRLHALIDGDGRSAGERAFQSAAAKDPRLQQLVHSTDAASLVADNALVASISFGDLLRPHALACIVEAAATRPDWNALYSDEDSIAGKRLRLPIFKPDWSPVFNRSVNYVGQLISVRASALSIDHDLFDPKTLARVLQHLPPDTVGHVRRVLYRRKRKLSSIPAASRVNAAAAEETKQWPGVSVVIPTRDRPELLAVCIDGLKSMTDYAKVEVIVVDNGSTDPRALEILAALPLDSRFKVLKDQGVFNYSKLCNTGAAHARHPYLVFLNNDIILRDRSWLKSMIGVCMLPNAGVVGAKLLFPNGRLQHGGVVLGIGGVVGHVDFNARPDYKGWLHRLCAIREVSAVTAACCAVAREKFCAVGGFDEVNLPIELSDIDFCLRIAERGWQNYWTPHSVVTHKQSASRGTPERPSEHYAAEREYFFSRWGEKIRDDPHFHPALSLFAHHAALG